MEGEKETAPKLSNSRPTSFNERLKYYVTDLGRSPNLDFKVTILFKVK